MAVVCYLCLCSPRYDYRGKMYQALPLLSWESLRTRIGVILHDEVLMLTSAVSYMCADMVIITETCEHTVHSSTIP